MEQSPRLRREPRTARDPSGPGQEAKAQTAPWNPCGLGTEALWERGKIFEFIFLKAQMAPRNPGGLGTAAQKEKKDICLCSDFSIEVPLRLLSFASDPILENLLIFVEGFFFRLISRRSAKQDQEKKIEAVTRG